MSRSALPLALLLGPLAAPSTPAQDGPLEEAPEGPGPPPLELTVDQAVALALSNNLDLASAQVDTEVARFDQLGSWGAFDWIFDARVSYTDRTDEGSGFLSGGAEVTTESAFASMDLTRPLTTGGSFQMHFDTLDRNTDSVLFDDPRQREGNVSVSLVQPLRRGAWSEYATSLQREAEVLFRRQVEVARGTRLLVAYDTTRAYWALVSAIEQEGVAESAVELGENRLEQNQRELDAGVGTEVDVLQAEADLATRQEDLLRASNDLATAMDDLRKLLFAGEENEAWEAEIVPTTPLAEGAQGDVPHWTAVLAVALQDRPVMLQRNLDVEVARLREARAASERLALVDLELIASSGSVDTRRTEAVSEAFLFEFPTYTAALTFSRAIGNRTAAYAERAARAEVRSALLDYDRAELDLTAEVRRVVRSVEYAAEQMRATATSLALAQRQLEAEEARFANDLSTTFQVLEFQQSLIEAMSNESDARVAYAQALAELDFVQGRIPGEGR